MDRTLNTILLLSAVTAFCLPAFAEEQATSGDELAGAGKVIEVSPDGASTVVKEPGAAAPAETKKGDAITLAESCRKRLAAQCKTLKRCLNANGEQLPLPCEQAVELCDGMTGEAPYGRKQLEACAKGLGSLKCQNDLDPADPASFQLEARVPACKPILAAEAAQGGSGGNGNGLGNLEKIDPREAEQLQRQLNEALGGH